MTAPCTLGDRVYRGRAFLKKAPVSLSDDGGRPRLMLVVTHPTVFLGIPEDDALALVTTPADACAWFQGPGGWHG